MHRYQRYGGVSAHDPTGNTGYLARRHAIKKTTQGSAALQDLREASPKVAYRNNSRRRRHRPSPTYITCLSIASDNLDALTSSRLVGGSYARRVLLLSNTSQYVSYVGKPPSETRTPKDGTSLYAHTLSPDQLAVLTGCRQVSRDGAFWRVA